MTPHGDASRRRVRFSSLNPRALAVRFAANTILVGALILLLPGFELRGDRPLLSLLWLAALFGVLTAFVQPALEFVALPYLLQTFGLVVILIDVVLLALLDLSRVFDITSLWSLLVGAVLAAVLGFLLENVLGLSPPVLDDTSPEASA